MGRLLGFRGGHGVMAASSRPAQQLIRLGLHLGPAWDIFKGDTVESLVMRRTELLLITLTSWIERRLAAAAVRS